jgi:pimeloyl-ACP methyl ester carboxylesterase
MLAALFTGLSSVAGHAATAIAHDGLPIYFEVHGTGEKFLLLGPGTALPRTLGLATGVESLDGVEEMLEGTKQAYIEELGERYRLIFMEYPGQEPRMYTLTPGAVARDYLAVADAAGAEEFAYAGFSWGCVTGLQLAIRSDRMKALVCGGFPVIDGIYEDMLLTTRTMSEGAATLYGIPMNNVESGRQFLTYYEGLRSFDDRAVQGALKIPRLSWIGDADQPTLNGKNLTHMGKVIADTRDELEEFGWDVLLLPGVNHLDGGAPAIHLPVISDWLRENY